MALNFNNSKNLTPNEEVIKSLLEELLKLQINLIKIKSAKLQQRMVINIIKMLQDKNKTITYQNLFDLILFLMRNVKSKESIAIISRIFILLQKTYSESLKNKNKS